MDAEVFLANLYYAFYITLIISKIGMMDQQAPNGADFMVQPGGGQADAVQNGIAIAANSGGSGTPVNGTGGGSTPGSTGI